HTLVHRLPEMLFTLDRRGYFLWSNKASVSIVGIKASEIPGRNIKDFLEETNSIKLEEGKNFKGTISIVDIRGNKKFVDCIIQSSKEENGQVVFDGIMTDVTDRERAITQREEMVQRLYHYQKMESIGMMASGIAHDFNNILQTVSDIASLIGLQTKEGETKRQIELINETLSDARFLVSELFALGQKKPLDYRNINLANFLEQIVAQFSKQLGSDYVLTLETPEEPLFVAGDPDHLKRVFQNLIGNARDAMPEGGSITISCEKIPQSGGDEIVHIRVSDTGTGIPPELTEKIFDPFFTTKKPGKGTGLGLALARRIIMLHHGRIFVEKSGYEGTVFLIELPLTKGSDAESDTKIIMLNRLPATILLLEDDKKICEVLRFFLKEFKYSVLEATDGNEAFEKLKENKECNILIMDWKLGNENPIEVIKKLRSLNEKLEVIVVSGYPPDEKSIKEMKIVKWFTKPYDRSLLDIEIQRILHKKKKEEKV
ncbi:MAG: ATP-binding protein, partial [Chitinispirillaceae bacterium]|nr:ATP-binding protein [Chitinispirillaceae bacterium]